MRGPTRVELHLEVGVESHDELYRNPLDPLEPHELKPGIVTTIGELMAEADLIIPEKSNIGTTTTRNTSLTFCDR